MSVRRYLTKVGEAEAVRILTAQFQCRKHVTSDDVRMAVRAVASQGGAVSLPPNFPPLRWVLEFKRIHGFVQLGSFVLSAASIGQRIGCDSKVMTLFKLSKRHDALPLMSPLAPTKSSNVIPTTSAATSNDHNNVNGNSANGSSVAQVIHSNRDSGNISNDEDENDSVGSGSSDSTRVVMYPMTFSHLQAPLNGMIKRKMQLRQRYQYRVQQQQRRTMLVEDHRRATAQPIPLSRSKSIHEAMQPAATITRNGLVKSSDVEFGLELCSSLTTSHIHHVKSSDESGEDRMQHVVPTASSLNDNRSFKLSHTVSDETWKKAIAAVEQQGMSLRAAAKLFGVHFAALHRRVKKRAQSGQDNGTNGYFHPSDEAGIMRIVVARAELGILMTFAELTQLVEAAARRKLPNISIKSAQKLLTRFQTRNEQSIRHIIDDWPLHWPAINVSSPPTEKVRHHQQ